MISAERLRHLVEYEPTTGAFTYKNRFHKVKNGTLIKGADVCGYLMISIDGKSYGAHRLAWIYMTGEAPPETIDHKDCDKKNNIWENLRAATRSQNKANTRKRADSTSPYKGVYWGARQRKWGAHVGHRGVRKHLGYFSTAEDAHRAYQAAAQKIFGEFARSA